MRRFHRSFSALLCLFVLANASPSQTKKFRRKCAVKDSLDINPALERRPPAGFHFTSRIDAKLMANVKNAGDRQAFSALFHADMRCEEKYVIPVAWHVIHSSRNMGMVSRDRLEKQVHVLNDAFQKTPYRFRMSSVDYTENDRWLTGCLQRVPEYMGALSRSPNTTMNIYTCVFSDPGIIGNSAMPWWYKEDSPYNGVVIHPETLPGGSMSPINEGDNLVHEVGHYFGLFHVFEGECSTRDDDVTDTPRCKPTYGCPSGPKDTCPDQPGLDPTSNYMGYTDDACMSEFTPGQISRMKWAVQKYRAGLMTNIQRPCTVDAIFRWSNGYVYMFSGSNYYRYNESRPGIDPEYPRPIAAHWHGVPSDIDGAVRYANGMTYFFKGDQYYRYNDTSLRVDTGYPRPMNDYWHGVPRDIDDVISYTNGYVYFFKGTQYYRFNPKTQSVDPGYPKPISSYWVGVPTGIEAAITWYNGGVYFFKDAQFWFFLHGDSGLEASSGYPKPVRRWWSEEVSVSGYTVFRTCNRQTYFFLGTRYWVYNDKLQHVEFLYPKALLGTWKGLPAEVQAGFTWSNGQLYFFSGNQYFRYNTTAGQIDTGYPKQINSFWKGIPDNIDAAFRYVNGQTYFFKGTQYYRFNDSTLRVDDGYPKPISSFWVGIPDNIDTVFTWSNRHTYFFKGNLYYRFNCKSKQVDPGYPKSISHWRGVLHQP